MNNELYRKVTYPSGKVRYIKTFQWDTGDPADGIWYIARSKNGTRRRWITKKLSDLPKAITAASIEPHRDEIAKKLDEVLRSGPYSLDRLVNAVIEAVQQKGA